MEYDNDIRTYLSILEYYSSEDAPLTEAIQVETVVTNYPERLSDIIFKLRSYTDPTGGDFSLGYEQGLEMAAQMIENLINAMGEKSGS